MQHPTQQQDIQSLAQRALERLERNSQCNTSATTSENQCNKQGSKSAHFVASIEQPTQPPVVSENPSVYADPSQLATSRGSTPRLVVSNAQRVSRRTGTKTKAFRVEIDGKPLTFINHSNTPDVRALMIRKFGADRVGEIKEIGNPREKEQQS